MKKRIEVTIPTKTPAAICSCCLMAASAAIRLAYFLPRQLTPLIFWVHLIMPVAAAVLFLAGMILGGNWIKPAALLAVVLGVGFFMVKATTFTPIHQILCTILYSTVLILFDTTVLGWLPTKKLLYPLFGLPLLYHLLVEDTQAYFFAQPPVPVVEWMPELSVLCIMASLLSLSIAMECRALPQ